jgi:Condensin II complex subunit CAP-H2 or CNDH2, C-term
VYRLYSTSDFVTLTQDIKTFEELCRRHIQDFARKSEAHAIETRLSKRVGEWHEKLVPILEVEENRHEFDILTYTERVVATILEHGIQVSIAAGRDYGPNESSLPHLALTPPVRQNRDGKQIVGFGDTTRNCPRYEVCRLFLSSLSLANSGNVRLHHGYEEDDLQLELIDSVISNPMEAYFAPTVLHEN